MKNKQIDLIYIFAVLFLLILGMVMMFSVSPIAGLRISGDSYYYIKRYFVFLFLGLGVFFVAYRIDYQRYRQFAFPLILGGLILIALTYLPFLRLTAGGASRWLNLGIFSFQPSELIKICLIVYVAHAATLKKSVISNFRQGVLPIMLVVGLLTSLVLLQPDLGTSIVLLSTALVMLIVSGANFWELFILVLVGIRALSFMVMRTPYQLKRLAVFMDPWKDPLGAGFNTIQSLLAVGSGGFFGTGLGQSRLKFTYLPQQFTDYIFAIICEEGGFFLAVLTIAAFAVLVWRGLVIAMQCEDDFGRLLATGATFCLGFQAIINMMVVTALLPTKGITLPFISYGGTSLITCLFLAGLVLGVQAKKMG